MNPTFKRCVAWLLAVTMLNPWAAWGQVPPPYAGDHLIYTTTNTGTADSPGILLLIDTSDTMNIPEPWREYDPDVYDSHVEYLWNSPLYINTISTADPAGGITTAGSSGNRFSHNANSNVIANASTMRYDSGWMAGISATERTNLRAAAIAYAGGTHTGDPGPRSTYRKYAYSRDGAPANHFQSSHAYIYWVPLDGRAAADPAIEDDPRLRSNSLNKFWGAAAVNDFGNTNPSTWPVTRGGIMFGRATTDFSDPFVNAAFLNQCSASFNELTPSTVYAPSAVPRNAGKMLGQQWQRWERWRGLANPPENPTGLYPGSDATVPCSAGNCRLGWLAAQRTNNVVSGTRDAFPVQTQGAGSHAGWSNLRPDMGGAFNLYHRLGEIGDNTTYLSSLLTAQGAAAAASAADARTSLYRNFTPGEYRANPTTVTTGGAYNLRKVRLCTRSGGSSVVDARGITRSTGGSCGPIGPADTNCNDNAGSCRCERQGVGHVNDPNCASVPDPAPCNLVADDTFFTRDNDNCGWSGRMNFVSKDYQSCQWHGRQATVVEAVGTYYHGGQCRGTCTGPTCEAAVNGGENYCDKSTSGNITISGTTYYDYRTDTATAGCSNKADGPTYWHGGTCLGRYRTSPPYSGPGWTNSPAGADDPATCSKSVTWASLGVGGTTYYDVRTDNGGCSTRIDLSSGCTPIAGLGAACTNCGNVTPGWTLVGGAGSSVTVYNHQLGSWLYHDCKADDGATVMRAPTVSPSSFGQTWNSNSTPGNANHSYSTNAGHAITGAIPEINLYSANYLNWKFGAKACRNAAGGLITTTAGLGAAVSCKPLGRKTRLQIAKDALTDLVANTNGVRFGLMVFNKMGNSASGFASQGGHIAYKVTTMGPKNCALTSPTTSGSINAGSNLLTLAGNPGFGVGNTITVPGAGAGGTNLVTTINSITGTSITLATTAATTVAGVTIVVPACSAAELTDYANRAVLINRINGLTAAARTPLSESLFEAYRYFRGEAPVYGRLNTPAQGGGAVAAGCDKTAFATPGGGADCTGSGGNYVSPMLSAVDPTTGDPAPCQKNFVLLVTDGGPEDDFSSDAAIQALNYVGIGGTISPHTHIDDTQANTPSGQFETGGAPYGPPDIAGGGRIWLDELAYYMATADMHPTIDGRQPVITYTIGFAGANTPVLRSAAARAGGNNYVADDADQLAAALTEAVAAIREWNPTGGAPTVPISALNRSENADDIYLAFFGPSSSQAWSGTVKKFRLGEGENLCGQTSGGLPIELCLTGKTILSGTTVKNIELTETDPITGEENVVVNPAAVSYWNPTDFQDGARPYQGGTGQRLRDSGAWTPATRPVYTFVTNPAGGAVSSEASLAHADNAFSEGNVTLITKARLGNAAMTDAERATRINFIRGGSQGDTNCADASTATVCSAFRTWPHHDVLHSRPAVVTYDPTPVADPEDLEPDTNLKRKVPTTEHLFYFSNDGLLNAIDTATGDMVWSFMLEEALPHLGDVMNNLAGQHLMLADGSPVVWVYDANKNGKVEPAGGDKAYLFFGLRRGGRALYALDITDPAMPQFMWKIDRRPAGAQFCTPAACVAAPDFDELGYTWSTPAVGRLKAIASANQPALIFGGGYDPNQDRLVPTAADTMGRAVYVVNGATGALLKTFKSGAAGLTGTMGFSIPSEVAALNADLDAQGHLDRLYVGDMAANLWRFDINDPAPANWTGKKLAVLSAPFALPATVPNRKIMTPPAVVKQNYLGQRYDAVYVGTGDREHPLGETSADRMFMIKDTDVGLASTAWSVDVSVSDFVDITDILTAADLEAAGINAANWATKAGWHLSFAAGEKVMSAPTVFRNILRFSTYTPLENISSCVPPGRSVIYGMNALYGGLAYGTYGAVADTNLKARQYVGFATRGIIPTGTVIVRDKKVYVVHVSDGRLLYRQIGTVGGAIKTYWYRQSQR